MERMTDVAAVRAQQSIALAAAMSVAAVITPDVVAVSWAVVIVSAALPVYSWFRLRRRWSGRIHLSTGGLVTTARATSAFAVASAMFVLMNYLDSVMVQAFKGDAAAGVYGAAYRILLALTVVATVYSDSVTRSISYLAAHDRPRLLAVHARVFVHLSMAALPLVAGGVILSEPLLRTFFGPEYGGGAAALAILVCALAISFPGYANVATAYALGLERRLAVILPAVVVVNAAANAILIPNFGIKGAAAATLGSELLFMVLVMVRLHGSGLRLPPLWRIGKAATSAGVMAGAVWPLRHIVLAVPILVGALVYVGMLLLLRAFDREDVDLVRSLVRSGPEPTEASYETVS
jgi:O-antigen/teichoic acid export membrane protein